MIVENQNPKPFTKGKVVVKNLITSLLMVFLNEKLELSFYLVPIVKSVVDITIDWIIEKVNNSKTKD